MARKRKLAADLQDYVPSGEPPEWMIAAERGDWPEEAIEYLEDRASYIGYFHKPEHKDRLQILIDARAIRHAQSLTHWHELVENLYPPCPLLSGETPRSHTDDAKMKAHVLSGALDRLLKLVGASDVLRSDLQVLLSGYPVKEAQAYSRAQRELLVDQRAGYREIERRSGVDQSEISQSIKAGHLFDPWPEGRT